MKASTPIFVFTASALAVALAYSASARQRWWRRPLAAFPARVTAGLATIVALKGWTEIFSLVTGVLPWLMTVVSAVVISWLRMRAVAHGQVR